MTASTTLFGAPLGYTASSLSDWIAALEDCWRSFAAANTGALSTDLARLKRIYGHGSTAALLRSAFAELPDRALGIDLPSELALQSDGLRLITPEGRILLDVLRRLRRQDTFVIDAEAQIGALTIAFETRNEWYESWANKQLAGSLSPPPIAAAILVLVNGSASPATGLYLPDDDTDAGEYETAVIALLGDFSESLGGSRPTPGPLRSHWAFSQATRLLSRDLARISDGDGARVYVREGREEHLLENLRGRLRKYPFAQSADAVRALVARYGALRGLFAAVSGSHERAAHTRSVIAALLDERS